MQHPRSSSPRLLAPEERAFFLQLSALNAAFEAARAGEPARATAVGATAIDDMLNRYFLALTNQDHSPPQTL